MEQDGIELNLKISKFCTKTVRKSMFNASLARNKRYDTEMSDNKENINTENLSRIEFQVEDSDYESVQIKKFELQDGDFEESEVEEGPRFSRSKARHRSSSVISKKTPRNDSNLKFRTRGNTP